MQTSDKQLAQLIFGAIRALKIDVPIMSVVLLPGDRIQLGLYGGKIVVYPPAAENQYPPAAASRGSAPAEKHAASSDAAGSSPVAALSTTALSTTADELNPVVQVPRSGKRPAARRAVWGDKEHRSNVEQRQLSSDSVPPNTDIAPPKTAMPAGEKDTAGASHLSPSPSPKGKGGRK